jgi:hypothetical protein
MRNAHETLHSDGLPASPRQVVVPVCQRIGVAKLRVVGTGFFIARYGLLATAGHVIDSAFILEERDQNTARFRQVFSAAASDVMDVGVIQLQNSGSVHTELPNARLGLSWLLPPTGSSLVAYAYPENLEIQLAKGEDSQPINCGYMEGEFIAAVQADQRPFIKYPHYETSLDVRAGASGAPVCSKDGRVIGICCRGWDFRGAEHETAPLSAVIPVGYLQTLRSIHVLVPDGSPERQEIRDGKRSDKLTFDELVALKHIDLKTSTAETNGSGVVSDRSARCHHDYPSVVRPTLLYIWRLWPKCFPQRRSM